MRGALCFAFSPFFLGCEEVDSGIGELPSNKEYEQSLLGALINEPALYHDVADLLDPGDFYAETHRIIYAAISAMAGDGVPVDILTLWERLRQTGQIERVGESSYLTYLTPMSVTGVNIGYYASRIKELSVKRGVWRILTEGAQSIQSGGGGGHRRRGS
jgi:replicative DNA helicase